MDERLVQKLRQLLPYIIITGVLFLFLPLFMIGTEENAVTYIVQIGIFPLTALGCGLHYAVRKGGRDVSVCLPAVIFYALTAFIYGMWHDSWFTVVIYMIGYFISGYIGILLGDFFKKDKNRTPSSEQSGSRKAASGPRRVNTKAEPAIADDFTVQDPDLDADLDISTTSDDIEAILSEIHSRKQ